MAKKKEKEVKQQPVQGEAESQPQKKTASKSKAVSNAEEEPKESAKKSEKQASGKEQTTVDAPKKEESQGEKQHREPQMVTVNGAKVSHAHAFQSNKNPEDWFFTAKIDGKELHLQKMQLKTTMQQLHLPSLPKLKMVLQTMNFLKSIITLQTFLMRLQ